MLQRYLKLVQNGVYFLSAVIALAFLVFVILNFPAVKSRLFTVRNNILMEHVEAKNGAAGLSSAMVWDDQNFSDIFLGAEARKWYQEFFGKYEDNYLVVPSLGISAPIIWLDSTEETVLQEKLKSGVGHYPGTAMPGESGNMFVFGHSSYYWWDWSSYATIFANLEQIKTDDKILVYYNNDLIVYNVIATKVVDPTDLSVLEQSSGQRLTLMTCTPLGTDLQRFIVLAEQIS